MRYTNPRFLVASSHKRNPRRNVIDSLHVDIVRRMAVFCLPRSGDSRPDIQSVNQSVHFESGDNPVSK